MVRVANVAQKISIKKPGIKTMKESSEKNQKLKSDFRTAFIRCDCDSEILVVRYDSDFDILDLCIYETRTSVKHNMNWYQKLRYIYQLLRYGQPYTDQILLQRKQIEELTGFLNSL